jgi:transcriptional regulator with XRE-family HTH domain
MSSILRVEEPDSAILREIGGRLEALRKARRLSQNEAATLSGISRRTLYNAEQGLNPTLLTLIRLLRTYGRLGAVDTFIPVPEISPIQELERRERSVERGRRG